MNKVIPQNLEAAIDKVEESSYNTEWLSEDGKPCEENVAIAKIVSFDGKSQYFIKFGFSELLDPHGTYNIRKFSDQFTMKKVTKSTFDLYLDYLKTGNYLFYTRARRNFRGE